MSTLQVHHDLALKILVGRALALKNGLPWTADEDRAMVVRERTLWAILTPDEQLEEQQFLEGLWQKRGAERKVRVNPHWGEWAEKLKDPVPIPDTAFGLPTSGFRPYSRGAEVMTKEHPRLAKVISLLWQAGFQPAAVESDAVILPIPSHRIVQEAERLVGMLARTYPEVRLMPIGVGPGLQIRASYDPATGQASLTLHGAETLEGS